MSSHRISSKDLSVGVQVEKAEHPWASKQVAQRLAEDHLRQDPNAYSEGNKGATPVVILNQNVRVRPAVKKKKPVQQQQGGGGPDWLPQNLRMWG
jgi:hypothetical protein